MQPQQQQQQQPGVIPNLMDTAPGAPQPGFPSVTLATGVPTNTLPMFPNANVAPQHSAPPVVYNSAQASQLVSKRRQNCPVLRLAAVFGFFQYYSRHVRRAANHKTRDPFLESPGDFLCP